MIVPFIRVQTSNFGIGRTVTGRIGDVDWLIQINILTKTKALMIDNNEKRPERVVYEKMISN